METVETKLPTKLETRLKIAKDLNELLANYQIHYQKLRGFHWNVNGKFFFDLHVKFEELYNDAILKIDELAERIKILEMPPKSTLKEYLETSTIKETLPNMSGKEMVDELVLDLNQLLILERRSHKLASEAEDEGTLEMLSRFIAYHEKVRWMLLSWLNEKNIK